jgi:hypothetical protein
MTALISFYLKSSSLIMKSHFGFIFGFLYSIMPVSVFLYLFCAAFKALVRLDSFAYVRRPMRAGSASSCLPSLHQLKCILYRLYRLFGGPRRARTHVLQGLRSLWFQNCAPCQGDFLRLSNFLHQPCERARLS